MKEAPDPASRLAAVRAAIHAAEQEYRRPPGAVALLAVSKRQPAARIAALAALGQHDFGENYLQEALPKIAQLAGSGLCWHFIGPLQSNKTAQVAGHFDWVHSVDRARIAQRLDAARPAGLPPLNVCIQVNISAEHSKSGTRPEALRELADSVRALPRLRLRGLMALPAPCSGLDAQRRPFRAVAELQAALVQDGLALDTLSLGTSADFEAAIAEGSTLVRIGTALFGPRD